MISKKGGYIMHKKNKGLIILGVAAAITASSFGTVPNVQAEQKSNSSNIGITNKVVVYLKEETKDDAVSELTAGKVTKKDGEETDESSKEKSSKSKKKSDKKTTVDAKKYPQFKDRAVVKADGKVNIRAKASKNSDIVGTLEKGGICLVDKIGKTWTKVESGNCVGYIKNEFLLYGDDAGEWSNKNGIDRYATVKTPTLKVRAKKDKNSNCITLIPEGEEYYVLSSSNGWVEIEIDDESGFVSSEYVDIHYENPRAVSVAEQEEAERRAKEEADQAWLAYLAEQETVSSQSTNIQADNNADNNDTPSVIVADALKADGNVSTSTDATPTDASSATAPEVEPVPEPEVPETEPETEPTTDESSENADTTTDETAETPEDTSSENSDNTEDTTSDSSSDTTSDDTTTDDSDAAEEPDNTDTAAPSGQSGIDVANYACQFIGNPYHYGGTSLTDGADCSGFVLSIYALWGYSLPHDAELQANYGTEVSLSDLQPGDLLFYPSGGYAIGHVAIYIGDGMIVHASNERDGIKTSVYNYKTPVKATRLLGQ